MEFGHKQTGETLADVLNLIQIAQLSQRDRAAGWVSYMAKSLLVEDCNWETIFYGHYKSVFNHCDEIGQQSN